ncbi:MAG: Holliday junction branch migration protein RuvA [Clostridia bacterium]|nr:Holliday junction branch migration protein RuvA [Clostridia bacterium]
MYYYISGTVAHMTQNTAVIDAGGVGYRISTSQNTLSSLTPGKEARLYTHLNVREDAMELYGFAAEEELNCFKMLISISGVGPKAALSILSATTPAGFALSVLTGDEKVLTAAQGIGKKLAQRIILELSDKLAKAQGSSSAPVAVPGSTVLPAAGTDVLGEALSALMVLEYSKAEALEVLRRIDCTDKSVEDIVRLALRQLIR